MTKRHCDICDRVMEGYSQYLEIGTKDGTRGKHYETCSECFTIGSLKTERYNNQIEKKYKDFFNFLKISFSSFKIEIQE